MLSPSLPTSTSPILRIAVRSPLWGGLDYLPPADTESSLWQPGQRIQVPLRARSTVGVLLEVADISELPRERLKAAEQVLDGSSLFSPALMQLYHWVSRYYHHPIGDVILSSLPKWLRTGRAPIAYSDPVSIQTQSLPFALNEAQEQAVRAITAAEGFQTFCLQGVTGSGKTAVYMCSMAPLIAAGQQILILVPEIALIPQTIHQLQQRFAVPIVSLHSELSDKKRLEAWSQAYYHHARIIVGTRSAVFAPLKHIGMIIIDEEHDPSFKQQSRLRYSARDVAIRRAQIENVPIVLGSATPSLETLMNAHRQKYQHLLLPQRAIHTALPTTSLVDLRHRKLTAGLSKPLITAIKKHLAQANQVLVFVNRRGYAPTLLCHHCAWMARCARCDLRLTLHQDPRRLWCHHCGLQQAVPRICPDCRQTELNNLGVGTEQLEASLQTLFPDSTIVRIDSDSTSKKGSLSALLQKIDSGEAQILVGTQMLSKGHHFPKLQLVAVVEADSGLYAADFRATERMAQLLVQVSGRAGRRDQVGEVMIQTYHPEHPLLQLLLQKEYSAFAAALLKERQHTQFPPFSYLALVRAESVHKTRAFTFLTAIKQSLTGFPVDLWGPVPAPIERLANQYRAQLLLQSPNRAALHQVAAQLIQRCQQHPDHRKVRWSVDIDPQDMS